MSRQAFRGLAVWFFANRSLPGLRARLGRWIEPLWPSYRFETLPSVVLFERREEPTTEGRLDWEQWQWRRLDATLDVDPLSGAAFHRGRRPAGGSASSRVARPASDLLSHVAPRRICREPSLVLHGGDEAGVEAFVGDVLTRFFALDVMNVPRDVLLLVGHGMGRRAYFQDALIDQIFQPRPVELMRERRLVSVETLHEVRAPVCSPQLLARIAARVAEVYGPWDADGGPVLLCEGGGDRASQLMERVVRHMPPLTDRRFRIIDPARASLHDTVRALAAAEIVCAPDTGEAALLALAPSPRRRFYEFATRGGGKGVSAALLAAVGENRTVVSAR